MKSEYDFTGGVRGKYRPGARLHLPVYPNDQAGR
jgi:hypothetical protein